MDRPALDAVSELPPELKPEEAPRIYAAEGGYAVLFGFGRRLVEYRLDDAGNAERVESRPSLSIREHRLGDLPEAARAKVAELAADYHRQRSEALQVEEPAHQGPAL